VEPEFRTKQPSTTFTSYGYVDEYRQGQIIKTLSKNKNNEKDKLEEISETLKLLVKNKDKDIA